MGRNLDRKLATLARELSFKAIFQLEFNHGEDDEAFEDLAIKTVIGKIDTAGLENEKKSEQIDEYVNEDIPEDEDIEPIPELSPQNLEYIERVVENTMRNQPEIDKIISAHLKQGWSLNRLAAVDRNILRLAVYELKYDEAHVSERIIINDAVEMAKKYGTEQSRRFVNGILGAIVK